MIDLNNIQVPPPDKLILQPWYKVISAIERRLIANGQESNPRIFQDGGNCPSFLRGLCRNTVEDDHVPFRDRGVPIMHLIGNKHLLSMSLYKPEIDIVIHMFSATPFPRVWHKIGDNKSAVDYPTVEKLNKIFRIFVAYYLQIPAPESAQTC